MYGIMNVDRIERQYSPIDGGDGEQIKTDHTLSTAYFTNMISFHGFPRISGYPVSGIRISMFKDIRGYPPDM